MRKCSSVVIKNVSKTGLNVYLVKYNKMMPAGCPNAGALTDLLDIKVNMGNKQTTATWQNGLFFSDIAMKNIDNIIQHEDCTAYAGAMISRLKLNQPVKK